jgi:putative membrane protein
MKLMDEIECLKKFRQSAIQVTIMYATLLFLLVFSLSACNHKQKDAKAIAEEQNSKKFTDNIATERDAQFMVDAAEINMEEIKLGQLAQQNALMPCIKEMGQMIETEHTKSLNQLRNLAAKKSITLPDSITDKGQDDYEKLVKKSGSEFDKEYCDMVVKGHEKTISQFEEVSTDGGDTDIRYWATETLPSLRKHLDRALNCQKNCTN